VDLIPPPGQTLLGREKHALVGVRYDQTGSSDLSNQTVQFTLFRAETSDYCSGFTLFRAETSDYCSLYEH
jgi:hypothetical protein